MKRYPSFITAGLMLAAMATPHTRAAENTWNNGSANFLWDLTSANWTSPTIWADGADAVFGATGTGPVTLGGPITVQHQTFNAAGYTIVGAGNLLTLAGPAPTITVNADSTNNVSLTGTNGLTLEGTGVLMLEGDTGASDGNHYTGGTYVRGGTLLLGAPGANSIGTSYAVDSIEALDAGATVKFVTSFDGVTYSSQRDQIATHSPDFASHLHMTGGTLDLNDDPKNQHIPVPEGTGLIINTGTNVQSGLIMVADGTNHEFSGVIADGGPLVGDNVAGGPTPQGPGRQIGIVSFGGSINGGGGLWTLSGSNTYSGSTRIDQGASIKLVGNGTIGFPTASGSLTGPMRMYGSASDPTRGYFDLNGHNQTIALMQNGNVDAKIFNSAVGTVSTLTIGYGNEQVVRNCPYQLMDNQGAGGIFALKKVATGPAYIIPGTSTPATNCTQTLGGVNTYSGDTTVAGGHLIMTAATAVSSNSAFRLFTVAQGQCPDSSVSLALNYDGTADVRQLWIDGVQQPNGVYGTGTPGINPNSIGTITVTGSTLPNTWNNGSANFLWDLTSANWTSPTIWADGADAVFGATGAGPVTLGGPITVQHQTFNAAGYTIVGAGNLLTLAGPAPTITVNADTTNNVSLAGTNGLTLEGTGVLMLEGDAGASDGNHYTGGTYVRGGTVILAASGATTDGTSYAVDSIEALDAGATVKLGSTFDGTTWSGIANGQIAVHSPDFTSHLHLTGGTFDLNNDPKNQQVPCPDGFGLIINNGSSVQAGLNVFMDGLDHTFSGVIADGNNGALIGDNSGQGPGYQIGIVSISGTAGSTWTLAGDNTYSGSTRIDGGTIVKLAGNHSLGIPTTNSLTGPMRVQSGALDLNGRNQTIALMTDGGGPAVKIYNSAVGTVSTLTVGYGNEQANRNIGYQLMDNTGVGGIFALRKINTAPFLLGATLVTNCTQGLKDTCVATYSGDTTIDGGTLNVQGPTAISTNSAYRINTTGAFGPGVLQLSYDGDASCRQLWINGVQQPNGTYGAGTPGIDPASTGTITVTGYAAGPTLGATHTGNNLNFSWTGVYKLQVSINSLAGPWADVTGGGLNSASVPINPANASAFYRLVTY